VTDAKLAMLITATRNAYHELAAGADPGPVYTTLEATYSAHGIAADTSVAESSIDWFEGGILVDALTEAIDASG
jgi:hypothetical protein